MSSHRFGSNGPAKTRNSPRDGGAPQARTTSRMPSWGSRPPKMFLSRASARRLERRQSPELAATQDAENARAAAEKKARDEAMAASRKRAEAAEKVARDARVREEERQSLLARAAKVPAADRKRFLDEQRLLAWGRETAAQLKREEAAAAAAGGGIDVSIFGIELDDG